MRTLRFFRASDLLVPALAVAIVVILAAFVLTAQTLAATREIAAVLANPEVRERIVAMGAEPVGRSTADFDAMLKAEYEVTGALAARIGLKVD